MKYRKGQILIHNQEDFIVLLLQFGKQADKWEVYYWWIYDKEDQPGYWHFSEQTFAEHYKPICVLGANQ